MFEEGCKTQRRCGGGSGGDGGTGIVGNVCSGVCGEPQGRDRCGQELPSHPPADGGRGGEAH